MSVSFQAWSANRQMFHGSNGNPPATPTLQMEPPSELIFRDRMGHVCGVQLLLKNKHPRDVYFKIKSNKSSLYAVRPSVGKISPFGQCKVVIKPQDDDKLTLQQIEQEKHQFKILSAFVVNPTLTPEVFWKEADEKDKEQIVTAKMGTRVFRPSQQQQIGSTLLGIPSLSSLAGRTPVLQKVEHNKNGSTFGKQCQTLKNSDILEEKSKKINGIGINFQGNKEEMAKKNDEKEGEMMKKNDDEGDEKLIEIEGEKDEGQKVVSADDSKIVDDLKVEEADKQEKSFEPIKIDTVESPLAVSVASPVPFTTTDNQLLPIQQGHAMVSAGFAVRPNSAVNQTYAQYAYAAINTVLNKLTPAQAAQMRMAFDEMVLKFESMAP